MPGVPKRGKRDANEPSLVKYLRGLGASVTQLSIKGAPDLLVGYRGKNYLFEVKNGRGKLTDDEISWHGKWAGQVAIIRQERDVKLDTTEFWEYLDGNFNRDTCTVVIDNQHGLSGEYTLNMLGQAGWEAFSLFGWANNNPKILFKRKVSCTFGTSVTKEEAQALANAVMQKIKEGNFSGL